MIDNGVIQYQIDNPEELMEKFYQGGNEILLALRNYVTSPENRKKPRTWGTIEAAKMVGVSDPTFRKLLENNQNISGILDEETEKGRKVRKYTLEAINILRNKAGTRYERPKGSTALTIAISNLKGGVGKTETAVDLAKKIAIEGLKVLLLDFDAQGTATLISSGFIPDLELKYEDTITNVLISDIELIHKVIMKTHFDGLHIVPANLAIQDCDLLLMNEKENNQNILGSPFLRLKNALDQIKNNYN